MRVLFALSCSEREEEKIIQCYKEKYGENLDVTSVYFFKSLIDTVRTSDPFDRIIIHENLEATGRKNKEVLDEYIFRNIDALTDESNNATIIFLCGDNRKKDDKLLNKLFNLGIYNILMGDERTFSKICELIKNPMTKKDAKRMLEVSAKNITYEDPSHVDEPELRSIREYYANNINDVEKIISGFDNSLYEQYTIQQLKNIVNFLPIEVRKILQANSDKYRAVTGSQLQIAQIPIYMDTSSSNENLGKGKRKLLSGFFKKDKKDDALNNLVQNNLQDTDSEIELNEKDADSKELQLPQEVNSDIKIIEEREDDLKDKIKEIDIPQGPKIEEFDIDEFLQLDNSEDNSINRLDIEDVEQEAVKIEVVEEIPIIETSETEESLDMYIPDIPNISDIPKVPDIPDIEIPEPEEELVKVEISEPEEEPVKVEIPEPEEEPVKVEIPEPEEEPIKVEIPEPEEEPVKVEIPEPEEEPIKVEISEPEDNKIKDVPEENELRTWSDSFSTDASAKSSSLHSNNDAEEVQSYNSNPQFQTVTQVIEREVIKEIVETPSDYKKVIAFIGAHKSGTTFIINAIADVLISKGVKTAILDLTKNKDTYKIYAANNSEYKEIAGNSIPNLVIGQDVPLRLGDLSIYTGIPRVDRSKIEATRVIEKIRSQNAVILVDCDFTTSIDIFRLVNNIFVVQDMDITKYLDITCFLRELKVRDIGLDKVEIIINKYMKSVLTVDNIVEALSYYINPEMTFVDELLPKTIKRFMIPFDEQNYLRYLECLYSAKLNFNGFSEGFMQAIKSITHDIYPISSTASINNQQQVIQTSKGGLIKNLLKKKN